MPRYTPQDNGVQYVNQPNIIPRGINDTGYIRTLPVLSTGVHQAVEEFEGLATLLNRQKQESETKKAQRYYADNEVARTQNKQAWNEKIKSGEGLPSQSPYFQDELLRLDGRSAGMEYRDLLLAQAAHAARAIDPATGKLLPDPNFAAIEAKVASQFANTYSLTTDAGSEEFAKFKILAKQEFQSQYVKMRSAYDEKYFEQKKADELGTMLNSYLGASMQPGFDPDTSKKTLKDAWKTTHDQILGFAGMDGRNIAKNAIHEYLLSGLGDPTRAKQILSSIGTISELPVGNTIVGKDPEIMSVVAQMRSRLQSEIREEERQGRADRHFQQEDAIDEVMGAWSGQILDAHKQKKPLGEILQQAEQAINANKELIGDGKERAVARINALANAVYNIGELGDVLQDKGKHQDYLRLLQNLRDGKDGAVTAAENADLTGSDRASMNMFLSDWKSGNALVHENGGISWLTNTREMVDRNTSPAIGAKIAEFSQDVMRQARAIAIDPSVEAKNRPTKIQDLFAASTLKLDKDIAAEKAASLEKANEIRSRVKEAHKKLQGASKILAEVDDPRDLFKPQEWGQLTRDDAKYSDPWYGSGRTPEEINNEILSVAGKELGSKLSQEQFEKIPGVATPAVQVALSKRKEELLKTMAPSEVTATLKSEFPQILHDATIAVSKQVMKQEDVEAAIRSGSEAGKAIKSSRYVGAFAPDQFPREQAGHYRRTFDQEFLQYPNSFPKPLQDSIKAGIAAFDKYGTTDIQAAMDGGLDGALRDLAIASKGTLGGEYNPGIQRLLALRGITQSEWLDQRVNVGVAPPVKKAGASGFEIRYGLPLPQDTKPQLVLMNLNQVGVSYWETPIRIDWNNTKFQDDVYGQLMKDNPRLFPPQLKDTFVDRQRKLNHFAEK